MAEMAKTGVSLPISSYRGPDVNLPWTVPNLPVDLQLEDVASRLYQAQEERKAVEEQVGSGKYPLSIARQKRSSGASSSLIAGNAQRLLRVQQDPRLLEMQEALSSDPSSEYPSETKAVWLVHFRQGLRKLIDSVAMSPNPDAAERQLDEAYRWYQKARRPAHHALTSCTAGPGFHDFCADEVLRHPAPPGSAFFVPEALDRERPGRSASHDSTKFEALSASLPTVAGRHAVQVKLASPRERLKEFNTRQLVRPLTARKLKDLEHRAEADQDRPLTPSTTCGGLTARSMVSARSPTPAHAAASRPTSAMSIGQTTTSGRAVTPRSFDRRRRPQSAASNTSTVAGLPQTLEEEIALQLDDDYHMLPYPATEAEHRMEKRWLSKRNRAITDKVVGEEQRTAVRDWAERRARVEEEISRNAEASRFQCALDRRRYCEPADALEDIDATVADDEVEGHVVQRVASQHRRLVAIGQLSLGRASFLAFLRLFNFWTRRPGTAEAVLRFYTHISYKKDPDRLFFTQSASETTPSSKGRVDCHRLRQSQCNRVPLLLLKAFCAVPLLSCQRLGTSQTRERMGATLRLATRHHLPSAGLDVHLSDFSYGVSLRAWDGYPPFAFPRAAGPDLFSEQGADWVTVDLGSEEQANVFSHNTVSTLVRLHITSGYRELCEQIAQEAKRLTFKSFARVAAIYGGADPLQQLRDMAGGVEIVVCAPGRMDDFLQRGVVSMEEVKFLVVDEADRMLDMGFEPQIRNIIENYGMPEPGEGGRQTMMFSATFPQEMQDMALDFLDPAYYGIKVGQVGHAATDVEQCFEKVNFREKNDRLLDLLTQAKSEKGELGKTLVFANTKNTCDDIVWILNDGGVKAQPLHGGLTQQARSRNLTLLKRGILDVLVATDVAARGLDVPGIAHVINYDLPQDGDTYVHRIGRTGRIGNKGLATSFVTNYDNATNLKMIVKHMKDAKKDDPDASDVPEWLEELAVTAIFGFTASDRTL
eukprot:s1225_g14.t2